MNDTIKITSNTELWQLYKKIEELHGPVTYLDRIE